jgi:alkylhydroperoxidase family enzyme
MDIGSAVGRAAGLSEAQLRDLPIYEQSAAFAPLEQLVICYAVLLTTTPVEVPDTLFAQLSAHFTSPELVELTAVIAWENYRARFNHALGIGAQGFSEGAYCVLTERSVAR